MNSDLKAPASESKAADSTGKRKRPWSKPKIRFVDFYVDRTNSGSGGITESVNVYGPGS